MISKLICCFFVIVLLADPLPQIDEARLHSDFQKQKKVLVEGVKTRLKNDENLLKRVQNAKIDSKIDIDYFPPKKKNDVVKFKSKSKQTEAKQNLTKKIDYNKKVLDQVQKGKILLMPDIDFPFTIGQVGKFHSTADVFQISGRNSMLADVVIRQDPINRLPVSNQPGAGTIQTGGTRETRAWIEGVDTSQLTDGKMISFKDDEIFIYVGNKTYKSISGMVTVHAFQKLSKKQIEEIDLSITKDKK